MLYIYICYIYTYYIYVYIYIDHSYTPFLSECIPLKNIFFWLLNCQITLCTAAVAAKAISACAKVGQWLQARENVARGLGKS